MSDAWEAGAPNPLEAISKANAGTSLCWLPSMQAYRESLLSWAGAHPSCRGRYGERLLHLPTSL